MTESSSVSRQKFVLDTPPLYHFALAERLDVLQDLLLQDECWTTAVVIGELKERAAESAQPLLLDAVGLEWLQVATLSDSMNEVRGFLQWVDRVGQDNKNLGEASVFALAEFYNGVGITDDGDARRVAQNMVSTCTAPYGCSPGRADKTRRQKSPLAT